MKIRIYEKALETLQKKVSMLKKHKITEDEVVSSCIINISEAYTNTQYYFIRVKTGEMGLYMLPGLKFLAGDNIIDKKNFESISKKEYKSKEEFISNDICENSFYKLMGDYINKQNEKLMFHEYNNAFAYLTSLYYEKSDRNKDSYEKMYNEVKAECERLNITYENDPVKILENKLNIYKQNDRFKLQDVTICKSKESIDEYFNKKILTCTDCKKIEREVTDFNYLRAAFISAFTGEFLVNSNNLIAAMQDKDYPNRESILKNYLEFFIAKDYAFDLVNYTDKLLADGTTRQLTLEKEKYNNNLKFMEELESVMKHDSNSEIYRFHAATSEESAHQIIKDGFYMYSQDLDSTTYQELGVNDVLTYAYGNGYEYYGDYIIILSEPKDERIVRELTEDEQEKVTIFPRRTAMAAIKPKYIIEKEHIVAIVDKEHERVILNPEYKNNNKKQL